MSINDAILALRAAHVPPPSPYKLPSSSQISDAEKRLGVLFHADYKDFLLRASDVCFGSIEPLILPPDAGHCDLLSVSDDAWAQGLSRDFLPICEDNGDFYCLEKSGRIVLWSHDGQASESWPTLADWIREVWLNS